MANLEKLGLNGSYKHLDSTQPEGTKPVASVMTQECVVENKPQELKKLRPFAVSSNKISGLLSAEAQIVLQALFSCFEKQKSVEEGKIKDLIWGFEKGGIPALCTLKGLIDLHKGGYIKFQYPDGTYEDSLSTDHAAEAFMRYTSKILDMVYEGTVK